MGNNKLAVIGNALAESKNRIIAKLGDHIKWEYFCSTFLTAVEKNYALLECTETSLVKAALDASQLRLITDGVLGQAYIVPYGKTATFIIGYKGLIELCLRSGLVKKINARVVYERDKFDFQYGDDPYCQHKPTLEEAGEVIAVYATYEMADGVKDFEVWPYPKLMEHKIKYAKGLDVKDKKGNWTSPWRTNPESMMLKTVIRSITKMLPKAIEDLGRLAKIEFETKKSEIIEMELSKGQYEARKKALDDEKLNPELLKDKDENPQDDLPVGELTKSQISTDQFTVFLDKARELKIPTKKLVEFAKNNGFEDLSQITTEKYDGMLEGLEHLTK